MKLCARSTCWTPAGSGPWPQACGKSHQSCLGPCQSCQRLLVLPATVQDFVATGQEKEVGAGGQGRRNWEGHRQRVGVRQLGRAGQELAPESSRHQLLFLDLGLLQWCTRGWCTWARQPAAPPPVLRTSLEQAGPVSAFQGTVPALKAELVLTLQGAHADCLHQCLGHARVPAAHAPLFPLQLQSIAGLVMRLRGRLRIQGQREDGQGLAAGQPVQRDQGEHCPSGRASARPHPSLESSCGTHAPPVSCPLTQVEELTSASPRWWWALGRVLVHSLPSRSLPTWPPGSQQICQNACTRADLPAQDPGATRKPAHFSHSSILGPGLQGL